MTRVKLNLASGSVQEREVVTAFNFDNTKYIIFDGESTGSMGLPIVLVSKESGNKVVGITDAEEWKNTKENLKKIISGEKVEFARVSAEISADDVYYRQLTLPIASFDILKSSYEVPEETASEVAVDQTPIFEQITPEDITGGSVPNMEPVAPSTFNEPVDVVPASNSSEIPFSGLINEPIINKPAEEMPVPTDPVVANEPTTTPTIDNYEELKKEFLAGAEELFNNLYNH